MKKLFLIMAISAAGLLNAKKETKEINMLENGVEIQKETSNSELQQYCQSYIMVVWCDKSKNAIDTVCYELGNQESKDQAYECMRQNGRLYNIYNCGTSDYGASSLTDSIY